MNYKSTSDLEIKVTTQISHINNTTEFFFFHPCTEEWTHINSCNISIYLATVAITQIFTSHFLSNHTNDWSLSLTALGSRIRNTLFTKIYGEKTEYQQKLLSWAWDISHTFSCNTSGDLCYFSFKDKIGKTPTWKNLSQTETFENWYKISPIQI